MNDEVGASVPETGLRELVVFSLESWNDIWRRNQHFVDILLQRNRDLRVLFVEPPSDPLHAIRSRTAPEMPTVRRVSPDGRLRALRPLKALPRRVGSLSDRMQVAQARIAMRVMGFSQPVLWLNDATYAPLIEGTGYPSLYDMTDDWLLAPLPRRELDRLRGLENILFARADEVVVCSNGLEASRGGRRPVTLIPNGVDTEHFQRPQPRPSDLPPWPVAVYVGSLHEMRFDAELVLELLESAPELRIALVGPDSLSRVIRARLEAHARVTLLGPRPYDRVPAYLQHADVIIVPHLVNPFTESLDPIKAYECLASRRPTVATPVAGFRKLSDHLTVASRAEFPAAVHQALARVESRPTESAIPDWQERTAAFERALLRAQQVAAAAPRPEGRCL